MGRVMSGRETIEDYLDKISSLVTNPNKYFQAPDRKIHETHGAHPRRPGAIYLRNVWKPKTYIASLNHWLSLLKSSFAFS